MFSGQHPVHRYRFVTSIVKMKWRQLAVLFLTILLLATVALATTRVICCTTDPHANWWPEFQRYLLILIDVRDASEQNESSQWIFLLALTAGLTKLVPIVGLFGTAVLKFLVVPSVFKARQRIAIVSSGHKRNLRLAIRIYNATTLEVVDITFEAYLRVPVLRANGARGVPNIKLSIDSGRDSWPIAIPFVPFTVDISLFPKDTTEVKGHNILRSIQSYAISPQPEDGIGAAFLVLLIKGKRPEMDAEILETHWFKLSGHDPQFEFGKFEEIFVIPGNEPKQYGTTPKNWIGWDKFDKLEPKVDISQEKAFIFGYGSLVNDANLEQFLTSLGLERTASRPNKLNGFQRAWNVAMDNSQDIPGYKYYIDAQTGERPAGYPSFLNIYRKPGSFVNGTIFEVPISALDEFDKRERNYDRIDVSDAISDRPDGVVWAYIGKEAALERFGKGLSEGSAMIDQYYRDEVERAFRTMGDVVYQEFVATTDPPTVPVRNLRRNNIPPAT